MRAAVLGLIGLCVPGCAGGTGPTPAVDVGRVLEPLSETTQVRPGETGTVGFRLRTPAGAPISGQTVTFTIVDNPDTAEVDAQGATLVASTTVTDGSGIARAQVTAGLFATFLLRASSGDAETNAEISVVAGLQGAVAVAPVFRAGSRAALVTTTIEVLFFQDRSCGTLPLRQPPTPSRTIRMLPPSGGVTVFDFVDTSFSDAILGRARDRHGAIKALGCVDLPGAVLVSGGKVQLALPLEDASPDPVGHFLATSDLQLWPATAAGAALAAPWRDLADCPLDPAQLWLDCTIDALSGDTAGDPSDCVPSAQAGGEGTVGDALAARRGRLVLGPDGTATACRGAQDGAGGVSADAVLLGLFGSPLPAAIVGLGPLAEDATHLLDAITIRSELDVRASARDGVYQVTHILGDVVFRADGALKEVQLLSLGEPGLVATATATVRDEDTLVVDVHGMTLRLGSAARLAFGALGLGRRALPADATTFVGTLTTLAHASDGTVAGCPALDRALCAEVGLGAGCLQAACQAGLGALAHRLDAGFDAADGPGLDLYLSGEAPLLDRHGLGFADRLGDTAASPPVPGFWSADFRAAVGRSAITGQWEAARSGN